jgi:hypothetical protein
MSNFRYNILMVTKHFLKNIEPQGFCGDQAKKVLARLREAGKEAMLIEVTPIDKWPRSTKHRWDSDWTYHIVAICEGLVYDPWWVGPPPSYSEYIETMGVDLKYIFLYNESRDYWNPLKIGDGRDCHGAAKDREVFKRIVEWQQT